jgi:DnaJ family protein C protein 8
MKEAHDRTMFERELENKSRAQKGLSRLPEDTFETDFNLNCRRVFDEIEDKKNHLLKMDQNTVKRRNQELELLSLKEHYKVLTEEEWERTRDNRIKKWKFFQQKGNKIGTKGSDGSIRLPKKRFDQEKRF